MHADNLEAAESSPLSPNRMFSRVQTPAMFAIMSLLVAMATLMTSSGQGGVARGGLGEAAALAPNQYGHGPAVPNAEITEQRRRQLSESCSGAMLQLLKLSICSTDYVSSPFEEVSDAKPDLPAAIPTCPATSSRPTPAARLL